MDRKFEFDRDRFGAKYWAAPVHSFGKNSPGQQAAPKQKQSPLVSPRGREGLFSAASYGTSAFSPVTPREAAGAPPAAKPLESILSSSQLASPRSPELELAQVAMRCVAMSDQLSSLKEQLQDANEKIGGLERHLAFSKESMIEAVNSRDALSKQFQDYKESTKKLVEANQRNAMLVKQQMQTQIDSERAHSAQIARMNAHHQEALDILREKLAAASSSSSLHFNRASELSQALSTTETALGQELAMLRDRLAACEAAELAVQSFTESNVADFSVIVSKLISGTEDQCPQSEFERGQLAARAVAAVAAISRERNQLLAETEALKLQLVAAEQKEADSRSRFEDFISELQRQLASSTSRECSAQARVAELSAELEDTTASSVAAISASANDISTLRRSLSECEARCASLALQLAASEFELNEVQTTLSQAVEGDSKFVSATSLCSSVETELRAVRSALKESVSKEALARSQVAECESKLASCQAVEAAARSRVSELEAAAKLWDVFVQEHTRKSQASVQLQSLLAAKSALADQQEKEISGLRQRNAELSGSLDAALSKLDESQAANVAAREQLAGTCFELDEVHATLTQVLERESASERAHSDQMAAARQLVHELESKLIESKTVEDAARNCVVELEAALRLNKESLSSRVEELELCRAKVAQLDRTVEEQAQAVDSLKLQLADSEISKISASDELFTARSEVEVLMKAQDQLSAEADSLSSQLYSAQSEISALADQLSATTAEAESSRASLKDTSARETLARRKELEASAKNQVLLEKLRAAETRVREMETQLETQTEFAAASAKVSTAMRDACNHSEIVMGQMKKNLAAAASSEASLRKHIAELEAQLGGYESYFSLTHMRGTDTALFGIGLFILSMNVAPPSLSTPRSSPMTPGKKTAAR
jgi:chromosome segregation ATPase